MKSGGLVILGAVLISLGMVILFAGLIKESVPSNDGGRKDVRGGGLVMIGPIPIIFGTDRESVVTLVLIALALIGVSYLLLGR